MLVLAPFNVYITVHVAVFLPVRFKLQEATKRRNTFHSIDWTCGALYSTGLHYNMETLHWYPRRTTDVPSAQLHSVRSLPSEGDNVGVLGSLEYSSLCRFLWVVCIREPLSLCWYHLRSFHLRHSVFMLGEISKDIYQK